MNQENMNKEEQMKLQMLDMQARELVEQIDKTEQSLMELEYVKNALEDLTSCLHYSDDWIPKNNDNWDDIYDDPKVEAVPGTATHRLKHGRLEDGYNKVCTVCCCCCCYYDSNRFLTTFFPSSSLLSSDGKQLLILGDG